MSNQEDSPSPFKKACQGLYYPVISPTIQAIKLKLAREQGKTFPDIQSYFTDNLPALPDATFVLLPTGGWAEVYNGSPFATKRPLGYMITPGLPPMPTRKAIFVDMTQDEDSMPWWTKK